MWTALWTFSADKHKYCFTLDNVSVTDQRNSVLKVYAGKLMSWIRVPYMIQSKELQKRGKLLSGYTTTENVSPFPQPLLAPQQSSRRGRAPWAPVLPPWWEVNLVQPSCGASQLWSLQEIHNHILPRGRRLTNREPKTNLKPASLPPFLPSNVFIGPDHGISKMKRWVKSQHFKNLKTLHNEILDVL